MKKNVIYAQLILIAAFVTLTSCNSPQKSCKDLFVESYQVNIDAFTTVVMNADSTMTEDEAREMAEFCMQGLYEIDSCFAKMNTRESQEFITQNSESIMDEYRRLQKTCTELFGESYQRSIDVFKTIVMHADATITEEKAQKMADFMLEKLYKIDSTYVKLSISEVDKFISKNAGHLIKEYHLSEQTLIDFVEKEIEAYKKDKDKYKGKIEDFLKGLE